MQVVISLNHRTRIEPMPTTATFASARPFEDIGNRAHVHQHAPLLSGAVGKERAWIWNERPPSRSAIIVETWLTSV